MARNYSNIALDTTLNAGIAAGDLSCVVASAAGWPSVPFAAVLDPGLVTEEVVQVTIKAGTTFTITRGFDGTTAAAHALGATVRHAAIAGDFTDLQAVDTSEASARAAADLLLTPMARTLTINGVVFDLSANRSWTVSGGVSSVTASAPLASSGGATPDISFTGILPSANGGTGVNNAGTLTNASNTTITGGGTLALGSFTLTVPATGSAALLGTANVFTAAQTITSNAASALAVGPNGATNPALQVVANVSSAITGLSITGNATGAGVTLTALGGTNESITLTPKGTGTVATGAFLRLSSGASFGQVSANAATNGLWLTGSVAGSVVVKADASVQDYLGLGSGAYLAWSSLTGGYQAIDVGIGRNAAGIIEIDDGSNVRGRWAALKAGTRDAGTTTITDGLTLGHQSTGTPAAGLGIGLQLNVNSSTTADQNAARVAASWSDATHATLTSLFSVYTRTGGAAQAERMRVDAGVGVAGNTGLMIWDLDNNTLERVTVGIADSGGIGFKLLRIPN